MMMKVVVVFFLLSTIMVNMASAVDAKEVLRARLANRKSHLKAANNNKLNVLQAGEQEQTQLIEAQVEKGTIQQQQKETVLTKHLTKESSKYYSPTSFPMILPFEQCNCGGPNGVLLYEHAFGQHQQPPEYFSSSGVFNIQRNDQTSAISVPQKCLAILFDHYNGEGGTAMIPPGVYDYGRFTKYFWNDAASSIQINCLAPRFQNMKQCGCTVTVYEHDFSGKRAVFTPGLYPIGALQERGIYRNEASSFDVSPGCQATVYSREDFTGAPVVLSEGKYFQTDLVRHKFAGDILNSMIVECAPCPVVKIHVDTPPATNSGIVPVGTNSKISCDEDNLVPKLGLMTTSKYSQSYSLKVAKTEGSNWAFSQTVKVESSSKIFGLGHSMSFSNSQSFGGYEEFTTSETKSVEEAISTTQSTSVQFRTPGAALVLGLAVRYDVNRENIPATLYMQCPDGTQQTQLTTVTMKNNYYSKVWFSSLKATFATASDCRQHKPSFEMAMLNDDSFLNVDRKIVEDAFRAEIKRPPAGKMLDGT